MRPPETSFHAHHSPMGAHSSLTCGMHGARGGIAMEKGQPADGAVYVRTNARLTKLIAR